jgi:bifunctional UDP-N-acetylglucosamine pyrophosphorylase/glucosamine-1-phosphate N-acetyltransferase
MSALPSSLAIVIIGAGKGTRMRSDLAKVLHPLSGAPLITHVLTLASQLQPAHLIAVVGHQADDVRAICEPFGASCVVQSPQLGTGHAVAQAEPLLSSFTGDVLVLYGDVPLLKPETIHALLQAHRQQRASVTILTAFLDDPTGYGRIIRDANGNVLRIVEERDASDSEKLLREVNSGIYCMAATFLFPALHTIGHDNAQGEQYLTDVVAIAVRNNRRVAHIVATQPYEIHGVNTRLDLSVLERIARRQRCEQHMLNGVTILDPATTVLDMQVQIGQDTVLYPGTHILGNSSIGRHCRIGPHVVIRNSVVGDGVLIEPFCVVLQSTIPSADRITSFTRLSPSKEGVGNL